MPKYLSPGVEPESPWPLPWWVWIINPGVGALAIFISVLIWK